MSKRSVKSVGKLKKQKSKSSDSRSESCDNEIDLGLDELFDDSALEINAHWCKIVSMSFDQREMIQCCLIKHDLENVWDLKQEANEIHCP